MSKRFWLGGHLDSSSGLRHVVLNARALNYSVLQLMLSGSREYTPRDITHHDANEFKVMAYGMGIYVHMPYIINPCEGQGNRKGFYKRTFREYAESAAMLGARGLVLHPGFKKELPEKEAVDNLTKFLDEIYDEDWGCQVLLETDAGSKNQSAIGSPEVIAKVLDLLGYERFGMCIDTVHLYARGTDLWDKEVREEFLDKHQKRIRLVHLNSPDKEVTLGSNRDLHNTPFEDRPTWDHKGLFGDLEQFPCILERRSLAVQEQDAAFIRKTLNLEDNDGIKRGDEPGGLQDPGGLDGGEVRDLRVLGSRADETPV